MVTTRRTRHVGAVLAASLVLAASGQGEDFTDSAADDGADGGGSGEVELRFAWWGADLRHRLTQEVIEAFEAENPGITVTPEYTDWTGYWDRLSTTAAAGDLPDVIQMDEKYLLTYANQGSLLDLGGLDGLDTEDIDPNALPAGEVDGALPGLVSAVNAYSMVTNTTVLQEAGVEVPDDESWTWEDFQELSVAVSEGTGPDVYGMQGFGIADGDLNVWARQLGESQWTEDGQFGVTDETFTDWWRYGLDLTETGAMPPPEVMEENRAAGQESSGTATNTAAFGLWWSNQFAALSSSSGQEMALLRPPVHADGDSSGLYYKPSMFWSASADTEHPEEVAKFLDFLVNSPQAGEILLAERGVPSNLEVREQVAEMLPAEDQAVVEYIDRIAEDVGEAAPLTPEGASDFEAHLQRYNLEVLFGTLSPEQAVEQLTAEVESSIGR